MAKSLKVSNVTNLSRKKTTIAKVQKVKEPKLKSLEDLGISSMRKGKR